MPSSPVNVGLIGAGRIGRLHAEHLAHQIPEARLVAIADVRRAAAGECGALLGIPAIYGDHDALLGDPAVEAVVICSSTDTHVRIIEEAAAAGRHLFCEKPIDVHLDRIDRALAAVEQAGVQLQIGFNRRFDPHFRRVRELVAAGRIGTPHLLRITSRDPAPPPLDYIRVSGGLFLDMAIHDFDMARYLIGGEVASVYAAGEVRVDARIGEAGDIDTAITTLRFDGGVLGVIDNCRQAAYGYDQRVEILGSAGMAAAGNPTVPCTRVGDESGFHTAPLLPFFMERYRESYLEEMRAFIACVQSGQAPPVTGEDGRTAVVIAQAARLSWQEGRTVRLSEVDAAPAPLDGRQP